MFGKTKTEKTPDLEMFVIHDSKVNAYNNPSFAVNEHELCRDVVNLFLDPSQKQNKYLCNAEDFSIYRIGGYERKTGIITAHPPEHVVNMIELRTVAQNKQGIVAST